MSARNPFLLCVPLRPLRLCGKQLAVTRRSIPQSLRRVSVLPQVSTLWLALGLWLAGSGGLFAAFGLASSGGFFTVDTGAGLVFKVNQTNGDITSLAYNGVEYQYSLKGTQINSGLGSSGVSVAGTTIGTDSIKITVTAPASSGGGTLTHYYMARKGFSHIYMATHFTQEPDLGLVRFIVRIPNTLLPGGPAPSDIRNNTGAIEASDVYGMADGSTRSKHYSGQRLKDWTYTGATGSNVGVWMVHGNQEGGSGGPFYRCLINQCGDQQEIYQIINYGEGQTEAFRTNVLNGPYTLVFTTGAAPSALDTTWVGGMGLTGYVAPAERGGVSCAGISNRDMSYAYTVGLANAAAQYWSDAAAADGAFNLSGVLAGTYTLSVYKNELAVQTATVSVAAGATTVLAPMVVSADPSGTVPLWRVGNWDGSPAELLNGDKVTTMHPSDVRMSGWNPGVYVVGTSTAAAGMPCYQWKDVSGGSQALQFTLGAGQLVASTVRVGITCAYAGGRPNIGVNSWSAGLQAASTQPGSRSLTVGTYRGNNVTYSFAVPASALVAGTNTLYVYPISGSSGTTYLSPGYSLDCLDFFQGAATQLSVPTAPAGVSASAGNGQVALAWSAAGAGTTCEVKRATTSGGPYTVLAGNLAAASLVDSGLTNGTSYYYVVTARNSSGTGLPSVEVAATPANAGSPNGPSTIAFYRFEEGALNVQVPSGNPVDAPYLSPCAIVDSAGGDDPMNTWSIASAPVYRGDVPVATLAQTGASNARSLQFDGSDDIYCALGGPLQTLALNDFTVETYVKFSSLTGTQTMVGRDNGATHGGPLSLFYLQKANSGNWFKATLITNTNARLDLVGSVAALANTWYHVALVGNATAGTLSLYVNGASVGSMAGYSGLYHLDTSTWTLGRGQYNGANTDFVKGYLDEVRFSNAALTPDQFLNHVNLDVDGDGLPDAWEMAHFGGLGQTAEGDADGDGTSNLTEFRLGLDPNNGAARFAVTVGAGGLLQWPSAPGVTFTVQRSTTLAAASWTTLASVPGVTGTASYADPNPPPGRAFYRILLEP